MRAAEGRKVPKLDAIEIDHFEEMLNMSNTRRSKYYDYLRVTSVAESNQDVNGNFEREREKTLELSLTHVSYFQIKQLIRSSIYSDKKRLGTIGPKSEHIEYGLGKSTLMLKVYPKTIQKWKNQR